ncbi:MAG: DUF3299 domain-containing protein [Pirellulales bacterium]
MALLAAGCDSGTVTAGAGRSSTATTPTPTTAPESPATSVPVPAAAPLEKTFDDIKFDIQPGDPFTRDMLTPEIEKLDGKRIRIRGWILPTAQTRGLKQFVLVRDNMECCFGPGAALYDCILVEMQPGKTAEFEVYSVAVTGEFSIRELKLPDGTHLAIYRMVAEGVE